MPFFKHLSKQSSGLSVWLLICFLNTQQYEISRISALKNFKPYCDSERLSKFTNLNYFHSVFLLCDNICRLLWKHTVTDAMHTGGMNCCLFQGVYGCILKLMDGLSGPYEKSSSSDEIGIKIPTAMNMRTFLHNIYCHYYIISVFCLLLN